MFTVVPKIIEPLVLVDGEAGAGVDAALEPRAAAMPSGGCARRCCASRMASSAATGRVEDGHDGIAHGLDQAAPPASTADFRISKWVSTRPNAGASPMSTYIWVEFFRSVNTTVIAPTEMRSPCRSTSREKRSRKSWREVTSAAVVDWSLHSVRSTMASLDSAPALAIVSVPSGETPGSFAPAASAPSSILAAADAPDSTRNAGWTARRPRGPGNALLRARPERHALSGAESLLRDNMRRDLRPPHAIVGARDGSDRRIGREVQLHGLVEIGREIDVAGGAVPIRLDVGEAGGAAI